MKKKKKGCEMIKLWICQRNVILLDNICWMASEAKFGNIMDNSNYTGYKLYNISSISAKEVDTIQASSGLEVSLWGAKLIHCSNKRFSCTSFPPKSNFLLIIASKISLEIFGSTWSNFKMISEEASMGWEGRSVTAFSHNASHNLPPQKT